MTESFYLTHSLDPNRNGSSFNVVVVIYNGCTSKIFKTFSIGIKYNHIQKRMNFNFLLKNITLKIEYCKRVTKSNNEKYKQKSETKEITINVIVQISWGKVWIPLFSLQQWVNSKADWSL